MSEKHGPNGFLVGLIIGGAVGALLSTKKGRQILKDVAEYGLEYVGNTINMEDIETILNEDEEDMMGEQEAYESSSAERKTTEITRQVETHTEKAQQPKEEKIESPKRRIFRGIRKR